MGDYQGNNDLVANGTFSCSSESLQWLLTDTLAGLLTRLNAPLSVLIIEGSFVAGKGAAFFGGKGVFLVPLLQSSCSWFGCLKYSQEIAL